MATTTEAEQIGEEIAAMGELRGIIIHAEQLLGDAYKGLVAVDEFTPQVERLASTLFQQSGTLDEEAQALKECVEAFQGLQDDYAEQQLHRAWRAACDLCGQLDDGLSHLASELRAKDDDSDGSGAR